MQQFNVVWFRNDLRLADNPALHAAASAGLPILAVFIQDEESDQLRPLGGAARWWLHGSLHHLAAALEACGGHLTLCAGKSADVFEALFACGQVNTVFINHRYSPAERAQDGNIASLASHYGVTWQGFDGNVLNPPEAIRSKTGGDFKVFSPYWRAVLVQGTVSTPLPAPQQVQPAPLPSNLQRFERTLDALHLEPTQPDWAGGLRAFWQRGEAGARQRLTRFLDGEINGYATLRDVPSLPSTSRLSPHLRFGEISPRQIRYALEFGRESGQISQQDADKFLNEVIWREFATHVLYHNPELIHHSRDQRFDALDWRNDETAIAAWQRGQTGFPLIDAGMRQLWQTGWMHNRVRMVVGSFLVKHLLTDWRVGESWFWDTLVDADIASNLFGWQWIAGCGFDAAPFHRIFNPVLQSERFDPSGTYIKTYVPELADLPPEAIHSPWTAPPLVLARAGIRLGTTYPEPIIDLATARNRALNLFGKKEN